MTPQLNTIYNEDCLETMKPIKVLKSSRPYEIKIRVLV